jgi:hypothetical protein
MCACIRPSEFKLQTSVHHVFEGGEAFAYRLADGRHGEYEAKHDVADDGTAHQTSVQHGTQLHSHWLPEYSRQFYWLHDLNINLRSI